MNIEKCKKNYNYEELKKRIEMKVSNIDEWLMCEKHEVGEKRMYRDYYFITKINGVYTVARRRFLDDKYDNFKFSKKNFFTNRQSAMVMLEKFYKNVGLSGVKLSHWKE